MAAPSAESCGPRYGLIPDSGRMPARQAQAGKVDHIPARVVGAARLLDALRLSGCQRLGSAVVRPRSQDAARTAIRSRAAIWLRSQPLSRFENSIRRGTLSSWRALAEQRDRPSRESDCVDAPASSHDLDPTETHPWCAQLSFFKRTLRPLGYLPVWFSELQRRRRTVSVCAVLRPGNVTAR